MIFLNHIIMGMAVQAVLEFFDGKGYNVPNKWKKEFTENGVFDIGTAQ